MRKIAVALALSVGLLTAPAGAQLDRSTVLVEGPPLSLAAPDSPLAVDLNPAALPYLPSWGLQVVHAQGMPRGVEGGTASYDGDAVYAAAPLPFGTAVGVSL